MKSSGPEAERCAALAAGLARHGARECRLAIVLGSGLGALATRLDGARVVPFESLEAMPRSSVPGHAGRFVLGELAGVAVIVQQGRVHLYEGRSAGEVTRSVRAFAALGLSGVVLTNACGALRADWGPGSLVLLADQLDLQGSAPLERAEARAWRARGPTLDPTLDPGGASPYDAGWAQVLERSARDLGLRLERGVYAGLLGPAYETPAEIRMLARLGADAVGMSTVAEAAAGAASGLRVAGIGCVTNLAAGLSDAPPAHEEVLRAGALHAERLARLLEASAPRLIGVAGAR